jgi:hypothetical protein
VRATLLGQPFLKLGRTGLGLQLGNELFLAGDVPLNFLDL